MRNLDHHVFEMSGVPSDRMGGVENLSGRASGMARNQNSQVDVRAFVEEIPEIFRLADDPEAAVARRPILAHQVVVKKILVVSANDQAGQSDPALFFAHYACNHKCV